MKTTEFQRKIRNNPRPLIIDLWAPWCGPCKAMEPAFKQVSAKYQGRVDVLKLNADESQDVLRSLGVAGIPTVIGFANGREVVRRTGVQSPAALEMIFDAALSGKKPLVLPPAPIDRLLRTVLGLAVIIIGWAVWQSVWAVVLGGVVIFTGYYDRCPIFKLVAPRLAAIFQRKKPVSN